MGLSSSPAAAPFVCGGGGGFEQWKPVAQCELRHLAFCNSDSIARARSGAEVCDLKERASERVWPPRPPARPPHQCYEFHFVSKTGLENSPLPLFSSISRMHLSRTVWPKYRARSSAAETHYQMCIETVSRNWQSLLRQMRSSLRYPARGMCCGMGCHVWRVRPLLHRKWPLVSVLINAGMKLRRHYLRHSERGGDGVQWWYSTPDFASPLDSARR